MILYPNVSFIQKLIVLFLLLIPFTSHSVEIIRMEFTYDENLDQSPIPHYVDIELYDKRTDNAIDKETPLTVQNFLHYVTTVETDINGDDLPKYTDTLIYRAEPGFVIQGGGYYFRPVDDYPLIHATNPGSPYLQIVPNGPYSPVNNEPGISNTRGTIAMAKLDNQPDSATKEWFINLADNSGNLDQLNGGFTVFGEIIDDGMNIADQMSNYPIREFAAAVLNNSFDELPVVNYLPLGDPDYDSTVLKRHLIMISSITNNINRPILRFIPNKVDFPLTLANAASGQIISVLVKNTGNETLKMPQLGNGSLVAPFSINTDTENCSNTTLEPVSINSNASCSIDFQFLPTAVELYTDSMAITYTNDITATSYSVTLRLSGEGAPSFPVLDVSKTAIQFENTSINTSSSDTSITVKNKGGDPLVLSPIQISGANSNDFSITANSCDTNVPLQIGETCLVSVNFNPVVDGIKTAALLIRSNGGDIDIPLNGTATVAKISVDASLEIIAQIGITSSKFLIVTNTGSEALTIINAVISGPDSSFFIQENNCPDTINIEQTATDLNPDGTCRFLIKFTPTAAGIKNAVLTLESNDPKTPTVDIALTGSGGDDTDGVPSIIEASSPNSGDGNNDEIPDATQNNVATLLSLNSQYITFISDDSVIRNVASSLADVLLMDNIPAEIPENAAFDYGLFSHSISLPAGDGVNMAILLPTNVNPDIFYKFGPTPDNTVPHWYNFSYDETTGTGAKLLGVVTMKSPTPGGVDVQKNFILISFFDGQRGDDDLTANGIILNSQSGISFAKANADSSGSLTYLPWLMLLIINLLRWNKYSAAFKGIFPRI